MTVPKQLNIINQVQTYEYSVGDKYYRTNI